MFTTFGLAAPPSSLGAQPVEWEVGSQPLVQIGQSVDDPQYQLDRVSAALWRGGEGLVIANGAYELRFYDGVGRYQQTSGRSGEGPGEFRRLSWLGEVGDSVIAAYDERLQRVSLHDRSGAHLSTFVLNDPALGVGPQVAGVLDEGLLILWLIPGDMPENGGIRQRRWRVAVHSLSGQLVRTIADGSPAGETFGLVVPGRGIALRRAPFSPTPRYAARGARVYRSNGVSYSVEIVDPAGQLLAVAGDPEERTILSESLKQAFLQDTLQAWPPGDRRRIEASLRFMMVHEHVPLVSDMRVDGRGNVWLRPRDPLRPASYWDVFSPLGEAVSRIHLPEHRALLDIADDAIVLLQSGEFGEDLVSVYELSRGR